MTETDHWKEMYRIAKLRYEFAEEMIQNWKGACVLLIWTVVSTLVALLLFARSIT